MVPNSETQEQCAKSFLSNGFHVHFISKTKVENIPFTIHGGTKPTVEAFSRLTLKYFENPDQLLEYTCGLQYVQSRQGKLPKVIILQDLETYIQDETKGALIIAMLLDALNALGRAFDKPIYLLAGITSETSLRILQSVIDNFFSSVWKVNFENNSGTLLKLSNNQNEHFDKEIKFQFGQDNLLFLESIWQHFKL
ncbi:uncharacterized protein LOC142329493 [Lycorma delicatula]|uniref:uncharacterized protein LOC142329493 n=1 Tax=Lycorma delicatula TaxID=130591 RepID=UPI003F518071